MEKQTDFEFADVGNSGRRAEPSRKISVPRRGTSICSYCGLRMPSVFLTVTPPVDDNRWVIAAPYHSASCRWVLTKGLRIEPPIDSPRMGL